MLQYRLLNLLLLQLHGYGKEMEYREIRLTLQELVCNLICVTGNHPLLAPY